MSNERYKKFMSNPHLPIPRTTAWRYKRQASETSKSPASSTLQQPDNIQVRQQCSGKRKAYITDNSKFIPRQTLWYWRMQGGMFNHYPVVLSSNILLNAQFKL